MTSSRISAALKQAALVGAAAVALAPTAFMLLTALKTQEEYQTNKLGLPREPVLENFRAILGSPEFFRWMGNSALLVVGTVALSSIVAALAAYAIARMEFRGRLTLLALCTALMAVPPVVMIVPMFVLYTQIGLISSFGGAVLIYAALVTPFSVYLLTTFFRTIPNEMFEAAVVDGASDVQILLKVVLPLARPALLTLVIVNALWVWNDLLIAVIFLQDDTKRTLMAGIAVFQGRYNNQIPLTMAGMAIASAPMIILYILFQRQFVRGLMSGAVK